MEKPATRIHRLSQSNTKLSSRCYDLKRFVIITAHGWPLISRKAGHQGEQAPYHLSLVYHAKLRQFTEKLKTLIGKWVSCEHKLAQ